MDWSLVEKIWKAIEYHKICRHSYVIAIGGGAFLDLAGFGAATAHRGDSPDPYAHDHPQPGRWRCRS